MEASHRGGMPVVVIPEANTEQKSMQVQKEELADSLDFLSKELAEFKRVWDELSTSADPNASSAEGNKSTPDKNDGNAKEQQVQTKSKRPPPPLPRQRPAASRPS